MITAPKLAKDTHPFYQFFTKKYIHTTVYGECYVLVSNSSDSGNKMITAINKLKTYRKIGLTGVGNYTIFVSI
jgi:hypothetical protein